MANVRTGLVLTGGGARAAYQVGALGALAEILREPHPFEVITGVSAGAINAFALAAEADDLGRGTAALHATWSAITPDRVYRTDAPGLFTRGLRWIAQLAGGGLGGATMNALLDTAPLRALLQDRLDPARVAAHLASGRLKGVAVTATSYRTGTAVSFFDGARELQPWDRMGRIGVRAPLTVDHVLASAAIPIFFPPIALDGADFGDGCVRLSAPLSPAIHLGAERLVAIGIRYPRSGPETRRLNTPGGRQTAHLAEIAGVVLNAVFLDSLESDVERTERINATLSLMSADQLARQHHRLRAIPILTLRPSRDLGRMAMQQIRRLPRTLRHLLAGIGASGERGWDIVSYLAFDPVYVRSLIDLGYDDTIRRRADIEAHFALQPPMAPVMHKALG